MSTPPMASSEHAASPLVAYPPHAHVVQLNSTVSSSQKALIHHPVPPRPAGSHSSPQPARYPPSGHDSVISQPGSPKAPYPHSASSNNSRDARASASPSIHLAEEQPPSPGSRDPQSSAKEIMGRDLEKQNHSPTSNGRRSKNHNHLPMDGPVDVCYQADPDEVKLEDKAFRILLHLSGFVSLLSLAIFLWALFSVVLAALLQPLRFCSMRPDYREQLVKFLGPPLGLQFKLIYATPLSAMYNTKLLLLVHLLSPFVAMGIALASLISAVFWIYATIIGDPGSKDGHNDGRESVLIVRSYWECWLLRALR